MVDLARRTADNVFVPFTIGGGIRSVADAQACSTPGPTRSASTPPRSRGPELIDELAARFGAQCVVLAIDAKGASATPAGRSSSPAGARHRPRRRRSGRATRVERGAGEILLTSMDRDGTNDGYDLR